MSRPTSPTVDELAQEAGVSPVSLLNKICSEEDLLLLARFCDPWKLIGSHLKLPEEELSAIDEQNKDVGSKRLALLRKWRQREAFRATFRAFVDMLFKQERNMDVFEVCQVFQKNHCQSTSQAADNQVSMHITTSRATKEAVAESYPEGTQDSGYESQFKLQSQPSGTAVANDEVDTVDFESPVNIYSTPLPPPVKPLFPLKDRPDIDPRKLVFDTLLKFGHSKFRGGQEEAIMNILYGISTLVIHPIGSGKSLCYQLPAYLYSQFHSDSPCITLVISPLISLMEDQIRHFPPGLKGECLHHTQPELQQTGILRDAVESKIDVLLLSPEALVGGSLWSGPYSLSQLPSVAFACIDEVHCVSEWSHCFRPAYFCIYKVLQERLGVDCILGLTATATHTTALSVANHLGIDQPNIFRRGTILPDHLNISLSCEEDKDKALIKLLQSPNFKDCKSIIVYCTRQKTTKLVAEQLDEYFRNSQSGESGTEITVPNKQRKRKKYTSPSGSSKRRKTELSEYAAFYHARAPRRDEVQKHFMDGRLRIIVATVAFGMGLNKPDIRAIIHYDIPKSFESFVQEIGRAGRDGLPAYCHVFIDKNKQDVYNLRSYAYGNTVEPKIMKKLLGKAFPECQCSEQLQSTLTSPSRCKGHELAIPIEEMTLTLDMNKECVSTLLCYLELKSGLKLIGIVSDSCTVTWDGGPRKLQFLAEKIPAIATAIRLNGHDTNLDDLGEMKFSVVKVADSMRQELRDVFSQLSHLMDNNQGAHGDKNTVSVDFSDPAFHIQTSGKFTTKDHDNICKFLCEKMKEQEEMQLEKSNLIHAALCSESPSSPFDRDAMMNDNHVQIKPDLRAMTEQYFSSEGLDRAYLDKHNIPVLPLVKEITPEEEEKVRKAVHSFINAHPKKKFTGKSVARIFHGIQGPCFPAKVWGHENTYWRKYITLNFNALCDIATEICKQ